ncbi:MULTISPECIES: hypothetical protein [Microbacterium]|uniref:Nitrate ABC transporter substrate-binding protein n=1 Tax=Microbacterium wangchenii TaxID=2541726 RepID=A0ABX5SVE3_9MICO|nr:MULTISPECIES: hypothetical protein [Microbacterium]MCK6065689.1 hypothetical protein [Microbacterium sp. EYE_512]QBR89098.1 hypothetical protein E4K62_10625 [Microbacterium wangchenii]TFV81819.1 hypothetical protein E4V99_12730 [Microbacterium sp. dk485]TXK20818.1 hypothetical protein FVP99_04240 [Microbacterium wangchenii]
MRIPRLVTSLAIAVPLVLLAGCANETTPETTPTTPAPPTAVPTSPAPTPSGDGSGTDPSEPTCETIVPAGVVDEFQKVGWSAQPQPFRIGGIEIPGGIQCTWGDYSVATDHVQIFGWAPIEDAQIERAQSELIGSGWRREEGEDGFYVTESADTVIAPDENGYGFTYFFSDTWVTMADTKQGLVLVEWPPR